MVSVAAYHIADVVIHAFFKYGIVVPELPARCSDNDKKSISEIMQAVSTYSSGLFMMESEMTVPSPSPLGRPLTTERT